MQRLPKISWMRNQVKSILLPSRFFKVKTETVVGINIGNHYLKGLILKGDTVSDYFIERNGNLALAIKKIWAEKNISTKVIKLSVKNPTCLVRYFPFPKMEKKRLQQALFYELNKFIPFSAEEVYFDYYVLENLSPSEVFILLAVAKKDFINYILETFKGVKTIISEINLDSICLINLFLDNYGHNKDFNSCILDIGNSFSIMTIMHKGVPFLTRDIKFNANDIIQVVSRAENLEASDTERWLKNSKNHPKLLGLIQDSISNLSKEMKSSFDYFEVNKGAHIDKLYLSGGIASLGGFSEALAESLEIGVEILEALPQSLKKLNPVFSGQEFKLVKNSFSVAFGLIL